MHYNNVYFSNFFTAPQTEKFLFELAPKKI